MKQKWNLTIDDKVKLDFLKIAKKLGVKASPWVESKMKEFIKANEELLKEQ